MSRACSSSAPGLLAGRKRRASFCPSHCSLAGSGGPAEGSGGLPRPWPSESLPFFFAASPTSLCLLEQLGRRPWRRRVDRRVFFGVGPVLKLLAPKRLGIDRVPGDKTADVLRGLSCHAALLGKVRQVQLAALGFEHGDLDFELGEFDVWISASPHFVESTSQIGESEDNDFLVGLIGRSMLMQKGPVAATLRRPANDVAYRLISG